MMHGLINRMIERFVRDTYGRKVWGRVMRDAGLEYTAFEAMLMYEIDVTQRVLAALTNALERPLQDILEDLGIYLVSHPKVGALRRLLRFGGSGFAEFLHSLEDLPARARLAVPELALPELELHDHGAGCFTVGCRGDIPGFGYVMAGVLRALAEDYGTLALLEHKGLHNDWEIIDIRLLTAQYTSGRSFELTERAV